MSEDKDSHDQSQKTEEATSQRLVKAREKGQIAFSKEINHWMIIFGLFLMVSVLAPTSIYQLSVTLKPFLAAGQLAPLDQLEIMGLIQGALLGSLKPMGLIFLLFMLAGLVSGFAQTQFLITMESIKPKFSKLSIMAGLKRIFSGSSLVEFLKGMTKIIVVSVIFFMVLIPDFYRINQWGAVPVGRIFEIIQAILIKLLLIVLAILGFIAGLDYMYQRFAFLKKMRMSKQDIKEEHKESDGDPTVKRKLAELRRERSQQQRIATAVPQASVIITNPTHYAVALKYSEELFAPICVAKGKDVIALRIRELGEEHNVPIIEDPPLARALYAGIEVDDEVPEKYYFAVARVVRYIMGLDKQYQATKLGDNEDLPG
jgi:flagellar biosynthetic protein FlhB